MKRTTQHPDRTDRQRRALAQRERELVSWIDNPTLMIERLYRTVVADTPDALAAAELLAADKIATAEADIANLKRKLRVS